MQVYKAIKYIRLSYTDDKTVESDSVANQRRLIDDYIARHPEIEVVAEKIDDGYSGVLFDRPAFQEMMQMIEQGEANCVIVKDLSRLGREYIETGRYMRRVFPAYGVRFIAINDNVDTENDAADDLTVSVKNIMNEAYCRDISVKTRSALEVKRRSGDFVGAFTIYGYVKVGDKHKSLEVDEYAANVVRDIFRKRLEGFSASHIADGYNTSSPKAAGILCSCKKEPYYSLGIALVDTPAGNTVRAYNAEKTLCEILKPISHTDIQIITDAFKRYAGRKDKNIPLLSEYAHQLRVEKRLRPYLEILL